ncbi:hypothetical protein [Neisseria sp. Ec49-e6-T10]|uniref:hypothetical protein n=1 Tax=Neisseria sp. Ec49-e6-T10 TaxID=3140744 RepID=UPI003EBD5417
MQSNKQYSIKKYWVFMTVIVVFFCFIVSWVSYDYLLVLLMANHSFTLASTSISMVFEHKIISSLAFAFSGAIFMFMFGLLRQNGLSTQGGWLFLLFYMVDVLVCFWINQTLLNHLFMRLSNPVLEGVSVSILIENIPMARIGLYSAAVIMLVGLGIFSFLKRKNQIN